METHIWSLLFNKVATSLTKDTLAQVFSWGLCEIFLNNFFKENLLTAVSELHFSRNADQKRPRNQLCKYCSV